jgi:(S)-2-hydroxyglutarate dehydrogenase
MSPRWDVAVVGGGIVGLATARALTRRLPAARLVVLEKEREIGTHQTGRNSGVLHSGLYYRPGSLKARFARQGAEALVEYCSRRSIPLERCGKVVVASAPEELPPLEELGRRASANGVEARLLAADELAAREPHVAGAGALLVPAAGIVDFRQVAACLAREVEEAGGEVRCAAGVLRVTPSDGSLCLATTAGDLTARFLVNCGGLWADRLARCAGVEPAVRIVPFRGEYFRLRPEARHLVRHLVYPLPDPALPFLGVHLHRTLGGEVWAGPNAVLAGRRDGYRRRDLDARDLAEVLLYPGFWRLARRFPRVGLAELWRSLSRRSFLASLRRLVPAMTREDLLPAPAGVRAQALARDGSLVDDFLLVDGERSLHVLNAPSPAATSCLPIGEHLAERVAAAL